MSMIKFEHQGRQFGLLISHYRETLQTEQFVAKLYNYETSVPREFNHYEVKTEKSRFGGETVIELISLDPETEGLVVAEGKQVCFHKDQFDKGQGRAMALVNLLDQLPDDFALATAIAWVLFFVGDRTTPGTRRIDQFNWLLRDVVSQLMIEDIVRVLGQIGARR